MNLVGEGFRRSGYRLLERSLRRSFRRIVWVGAWAPPPPGRPVVLYANHHAFHDAQILGWTIERVLGRRTVVWMEELERFPFFAPLGAAPFPADRPRERAAEVRRTRHLMASDPRTTLLYFPEAELHPIEDGIRPFSPDRFARLQRVLPPVSWWPVVLRITGWNDALPTAELRGGPPHDRVTGAEADTLTALLTAHDDPGTPRRTLLEGITGPHERWDFSFAHRLFMAIR